MTEELAAMHADAGNLDYDIDYDISNEYGYDKNRMETCASELETEEWPNVNTARARV